MTKINLTSTVTFVRPTNPRRPTACGYAFYQYYKAGQTIAAILAAAKADQFPKAQDHLRWDLNHGAIRVDEPAIGDDQAVVSAILGA